MLRAFISLFRKQKDMVAALAAFGGEETPFSEQRSNTPEEDLLLPDEEIVFDAVPTHKTFSCRWKSVHLKIPAQKQETSRLRITKRGSDYFWKSRKNAKLVGGQRGKFYYFAEPGTGGHIKIVEIEGSFAFMEYFSSSMITYTYWGVGDEFKP